MTHYHTVEVDRAEKQRQLNDKMYCGNVELKERQPNVAMDCQIAADTLKYPPWSQLGVLLGNDVKSFFMYLDGAARDLSSTMQFLLVVFGVVMIVSMAWGYWWYRAKKETVVLNEQRERERREYDERAERERRKMEDNNAKVLQLQMSFLQRVIDKVTTTLGGKKRRAITYQPRRRLITQRPYQGGNESEWEEVE